MVAVSHTHKFIFVKTHKVAGTSIEMWLEPFCTPPGHKVSHKTEMHESDHGIIGARMFKEAEGRPKWFHHMGVKPLRNMLGDDIFDRYFKISAVRDPFDRALSSFFWTLKRAKAPDPANFDLARELFHEFLFTKDYVNEYNRVHLDDTYVIDYTIRYEHLENDLLALADRFGLDTSQTELKVTKRTSQKRFDKPLTDYFDSRTAARVVEVDGWIFDRFGYPRTPFTEPAGLPAMGADA